MINIAGRAPRPPWLGDLASPVVNASHPWACLGNMGRAWPWFSLAPEETPRPAMWNLGIAKKKKKMTT
jgi:hypothetical protein